MKPSSSDRAKDVQQAGLDFNFGENLIKSKSPNKFAIIEESDESKSSSSKSAESDQV